MEDVLQYELRKPGANAPEDPTNGTPEESITLDGLNLTEVVQQSTGMIVSKRMKRASSEPEISHSARWSHKPRGAWDRGEKWVSIVPLSTDRLVAYSTDRLVAYSTDRLITFRRPCRSIHLSRNLASERKSE